MIKGHTKNVLKIVDIKRYVINIIGNIKIIILPSGLDARFLERVISLFLYFSIACLW